MASPAAKQVFISYSTKDSAAAQAICAALEAADVGCWIAPRDLSAGGRWGGGIVAAIEACKAVVVVFSSASNDSPQVVREMELAVAKRLPLIPVRVEDVMPTHDMQFFLGVSHWFNAFPGPVEGYLPDIVTATRRVLDGQARAWNSFTRRLPRKRSAQMALAGGVALAAVVGLGLMKPSANTMSGSTFDLRQAGGSTAAGGKATLVRSTTSDGCDAGPAAPKRPARDIDGIYPGMKFSDARKILLCRYPEVTQQASFAQYDIAGGQVAKLRNMTFRYPPQGGSHRGGEFKLIYDGEDGDGVVLYVSHLHYFDEFSAPTSTQLINDFAARYGASTRKDEIRPDDSESVVFPVTGDQPLVVPPDPPVRDLGGLSPEEAMRIRAVSDYKQKLYRCRAAVTGARFDIEDICGLAIGIRVTQGGDRPPTAVMLTSFDMTLTRQRTLGS